MCFAIRISQAQTRRGTLSAHQFFWLELLCLLLRPQTILHSAKVRILALVALVVRQFERGPPLQVSVVIAVGIFDSRIFVNPFVFGPFNRHFVHFFLKLKQLLQFSVQFYMVGLEGHLLFTRGAIQEIPGDSRGRPSAHYSFGNAPRVEDVSAAEPDRRFIAKT